MSTTTPDITARDELKLTLTVQLSPFREMGFRPDSDPVVSALADYVIGLAGHVAAGTVRFEGQADGGDGAADKDLGEGGSAQSLPASALSVALAPFLRTARGIPDNWPTECVLNFEEEPVEPHRQKGEDDCYRQRIGYLSAACGDAVGPTIGEWRKLAVVAHDHVALAGKQDATARQAIADRYFGPDWVAEIAKLLRQRDAAIRLLSGRYRKLIDPDRAAEELAGELEMGVGEVRRIAGLETGETRA